MFMTLSQYATGCIWFGTVEFGYVRYMYIHCSLLIALVHTIYFVWIDGLMSQWSRNNFDNIITEYLAVLDDFEMPLSK